MSDIKPPSPPPPPPDPAIIQQPEFKKHRREFDPVVEYKALFDGKAYLPNFEPIPLWKAADLAVGHYGDLRRGYARLPGDREHAYNRALFMLEDGQFRGWNGRGYVIISKGYAADESRLVTGKFALCVHETVEDPGANHQRGWHPSHCVKCGLDTSVDSGD